MEFSFSSSARLCSRTEIVWKKCSIPSDFSNQILGCYIYLEAVSFLLVGRFITSLNVLGLCLLAVDGEPCDGAVGPSSSTTDDVTSAEDHHEDCSQGASMPNTDTSPNSTPQTLPASTQSAGSSSAAKPSDSATGAASFKVPSSSAQGSTSNPASSSSSSSSPALGEVNASGGGCGGSSNSTPGTTDGAKPRQQQAPSSGASDPLPPG